MSDRVIKCEVCGFLSKDIISLKATYSGVEKMEHFCPHCYELEKYSLPNCGNENCKKCEHITTKQDQALENIIKKTQDLETFND